MKVVPLYDEQTLLAKVAEGDEKAFEQLVRTYSHLIAAHIFHISHSMEHTEELVQDVFLKIWMTRENLAGVKNFRAYLYVISRNQAFNAVDSITRLRAHHKKWEQSITTDAVNEDRDPKEEQLSLLDRAIAQLPPQQRKAWLLSRHHRLKYKEIALEMNLSQETVKYYIQLASQSITKYMESHIGILLLGILLEKTF